MAKVEHVDARAISNAPVRFTKRQYEYLEKVFGENPGSHNTSDAQLRWNSGVRSVVLHIKSLVDNEH